MFVVVQFSVVSRFSVCKNAGFVESKTKDTFEGASSWSTQPNLETYGGQCIELIAQTHTHGGQLDTVYKCIRQVKVPYYA